MSERQTGFLRVGVIGLGMGWRHVQQFQRHTGCRVVAVADCDPRRLQQAADNCGVPHRYLDGGEMIARQNLDVVSIATPNVTHKPLVLAALAAGCHVLCEKPLAMNTSDGRQMVRAARKAGRRLMVNFSFRFDPHAWRLKQQIADGALGEVYFGRTVWHRRSGVPKLGGWFCRRSQSGGGPLIDLGVHRLDLALWLMGFPAPQWVLASTYDHLGSALARRCGKPFDVEDMAVGLIRFRNGATLELETSWASHIGEAELMETRLLGSRGGLVHRNVGEGYDFTSQLFHDNGQPDPLPDLSNGHAPPTPCCHFIDSILHGKPHLCSGEEALAVSRLLDAMYRSARLGRPVQLTAPRPRREVPTLTERRLSPKIAG